MLFAVGLAGSAYSSAPFGFTSRFNFRNGPFLALIMFVSGYAMQRHGQKVKLLPAGIALALGGFILQLVESAWIHQHWGAPLMHDYVLGTYFFGLGMGMIALSNIPLLRIRTMTAIGPLMLGVYACHVFFVEKARPLERFVHQSLFQELAYVVAVFLLSLGVTFILSRWRYTRQFVT